MTIPSITPYSGTLPQRSDPANFPTNADDFVAWQEGTLAPELAATVTAINTTVATMSAIAAGGAMTLPYTFSSTTTDADPGAGFVRLSSATQNASTVIRLDLVGADGSTWTDVISTFDDSTSTVKGYVLLQKLTDATKWLEFSVSSLASPAGYKNLTVVPVAGSAASPFADGDSLVLKFTANGDKGDTGSIGPNAGLTLLATLTPTVAANVDFLTAFSSTYDAYEIVCEGILPDSGTAQLYLRVATGGSADSGSNYYTRSIDDTSAGSAATNYHPVTNSVLSTGKGCCASVRVTNANDATNMKMIESRSVSQTNATDFFSMGRTSAYTPANTVSGFRLLWSGANFAATGKIRVYGYSNT